MAIDAGRLRHLVNIEKAELVQDSSGDTVSTWAPFASGVYASIEPVSGREFIAARAEASKITARIVVRHRPGLDGQLSVVHRGTRYNVEAALTDPETGLEYVTLLVSAGVRQAP